MPASKTKSSKAPVKLKDMKAKKNPKGGLNFTKIKTNAASKQKPDFSWGRNAS